MSLLIVIPLVWLVIVGVTMALLRMAAMADAEAEYQAHQEQWRRAGDRLRRRNSVPPTRAGGPTEAGERPAARSR